MPVDGKVDITIKTVARDMYYIYTVSNGHSSPCDHEKLIVIYTVLFLVMHLWYIGQNFMKKK